MNKDDEEIVFAAACTAIAIAIPVTIIIVFAILINNIFFKPDPNLLVATSENFSEQLKNVEITGETTDNASYFYLRDNRFIYKNENYVSTNNHETNYVQYIGDINSYNYIEENEIHAIECKIRILNTSFIEKEQYTQYRTTGWNGGLFSSRVNTVTKPEVVTIYKDDVVIEEVEDDLFIFLIIYRNGNDLMLARTSELITKDNADNFKNYIIELYNLDKMSVTDDYVYSKPETVYLNQILNNEVLEVGNQDYSCKETVYMKEGILISDEQYKDYCIIEVEPEKKKNIVETIFGF